MIGEIYCETCIINNTSFSSCYHVRWNIFGSVPLISAVIVDTDDGQLLIRNQSQYVLSMSGLTEKAARTGSPPPYDDPPAYDVAITMCDQG